MFFGAAPFFAYKADVDFGWHKHVGGNVGCAVLAPQGRTLTKGDVRVLGSAPVQRPGERRRTLFFLRPYVLHDIHPSRGYPKHVPYVP